jgi:hypothetical protein
MNTICKYYTCIKKYIGKKFNSNDQYKLIIQYSIVILL